MIQRIYQKAIKFAGEKHKDQKVKGTESSYLVHLSNVAMEVMMAYQAEQNFDLEYAVQVAILHDTLEDTDTGFSEIEHLFGENIANGVLALTKNESLPKGERIYDSLVRIKQLQQEVSIVKLCDRIYNMQKPPAFWTREKIVSYLEDAKMISSMLKNINTYLNTRLESEIIEYQKYI